MHSLLTKLNFKTQKKVLVLHEPVELKNLFKEFSADISIHSSPTNNIEAVIIFVSTLNEITQAIHTIKPYLTDSTLMWFCYPKRSSKRYSCEFNRDTGWQNLGDMGYEPVRQVAISEDWSALRFKHDSQIKTMTRSFAMSKEGKAKSQKK